MAATAIAAVSSSSTAVPLCKKLLHLPFEYHSLSPIPRPKPIKALKLKTVSPHTPPFSLRFRSLLSRASASAFTQQPESESETQSEQDEYSDDDDGQVQTERRLYVGNLPYAITNSELGEIFGEAGIVKSVEIVYDRVTDRSRGFGFVKMGSVEEAQEAIRMFDGSQIGGRTVRVNFPEVPRGGEREVMGPRIQNSYHAFVDSPHKLYAGNLSWNITSQGLREAFEDQPGVLSTKVIYDRDTGRSRGFGFIAFSSAEDAESALNAMNGVGLEGRPLRLNMADGRAVAPRQPRYSENNFNNSEMFSSLSP